MQPVFPRINHAISYTLEYYEIGRIKDYMLHLARRPGLISHPSHLEGWNEFMFLVHERMEDEIKQTIFTTTPETKIYLFETLKEWLHDHRIGVINQPLIQQAIERYNEKTYAEFEVRLAKEVENFQQSPNFDRLHLEEYEVKHNYAGLFGGGLLGLPSTSKEINYKYYCIKDSPQLIDTDLIPIYLQILEPIVLNFRRILAKYAIMYDEGKIVGRDPIGEKKGLPAVNEHTSLLEPPKSKIRFTLSLPRVAFLFKMLNDLSPEIFDVKTKAELYRLISENFATKGSEEISVNKLKILFNDTDKDVANFWVANLQKMLQQARKV